MTIWQKIIPVLVILALVGLGAAGYFYNQYQKAQTEIQTIRTDPSTVRAAAQAEVKRLVEEVGRLIALPEGEDPTVATITDIAKLRDQPFFKNAKNGDKVLIYTQAKRAILYDPDLKKIIDVAPINIGSPSAQLSQSRIVLRNGTNVSGLTNRIEADIKRVIPAANIVKKENASKNDYAKTIVVALSENLKDETSSLGRILNAEVSDLPSEESKPKDADILVIIGKDKAPASSPTPTSSPSPPPSS